MKDSHQDIRVCIHNDTDTGYAERHDTRQSAARPGRSPQDQPCARAVLKQGNNVTKGEKTGRLNEGKKGEGTKINPKNKSKSKEKRLNPGDKMERLA